MPFFSVLSGIKLCLDGVYFYFREVYLEDFAHPAYMVCDPVYSVLSAAGVNIDVSDAPSFENRAVSVI
jgi:hypothetical protein